MDMNLSIALADLIPAARWYPFSARGVAAAAVEHELEVTLSGIRKVQFATGKPNVARCTRQDAH